MREAGTLGSRQREGQAGSPPKGHSRDQVREAGRVGGC